MHIINANKQATVGVSRKRGDRFSAAGPSMGTLEGADKRQSVSVIGKLHTSVTRLGLLWCCSTMDNSKLVNRDHYRGT